MTRSVLFALALTACATGGVAPPDLPTIEVVNTGIDAVAIYSNGHRVASIGPGHSACVVIRQPGSTVLTARAVGGGSTSSLPMDTSSSDWRWTINRIDQFDSIATIPSQRCRP